ncbi:MAG TPA: 4Fe-4S ferredoxin [Cytophagales bacterium]|nr:4Fe-4S ferredoxin [Cytophagales bacterium]HAP59552.1 4Fe-4S ferredoxin [Cytophagales bacterium]
MSNKGANSGYWGAVSEAVSSLRKGLQLSFRHLAEARKKRPPIGVEDSEYFQHDTGRVTLQYPREELPVPTHGRYKLHNEIEDCIVCDKCAKVCPVNCIDIEPIRSAETIGQTSDGTTKRIYAAKFDIDMAKCCFCGLCTTVCPTECLTMTPEYDFSVFDIAEHNFPFATMSEGEITEKKDAWDKHQAEKAAQKAAKPAGTKSTAKPTFKPKMPTRKPNIPPKKEGGEGSE